MKTQLRKVNDWVNERWPLAKFIQWGLHEQIIGGTRFSYALGSAALFLFVVLILTGVWQMFYYVPSIDHAYASLNYLRFEVPFGWLIHGLHYWGAHAFTVVVGLHTIRVFLWGAYKAPRELVWLAGVILLILTAFFMFTGPVLPWDKKGYWAGEVGLNMAASIPGIGSLLQAFFQGSGQLGQFSLTRIFVIHVALLPFLTVLFVIIHLIAFRQYGSVGPWEEKKRKKVGQFWPEQLFKDAIVSWLILLLLVWLSAFAPAPVGGLADPMDTLYTPKPEWPFLFLYQLLKYFHGAWEPMGTVGMPLLIILLLCSLPFVDRSPQRNPFKRMFVVSFGFLFVFFVLGLTFIGYWNNPPSADQARWQLENIQKVQKQFNDKGLQQEMAGVRPRGVRQTNLPPQTNLSGEKLFRTLGCIECHSITGQASSNQGPDLPLVLNKNVSRDWLWVQLVAPQKHNPFTRMPTYSHLDDEQLDALIDFLQELASRRPRELVTEAVLQKQGEELFRSIGCVQCHTIDEQVKGKLGPDLARSLGEKKVSREWLHAQLVNPRVHNAQTIMPSYVNLDSHQLDALVAFLKKLSGQRSPETSPVRSVQPIQGAGESIHILGNREHGQALYQQYCMQCHGPEGKSGAKDFPPLPGVPGLNPIRRDFYSPDPAEFIRKIDPIMQHGISNSSGGPVMPPFGDEHSLTQAQIADIESYILQLNGVDREKIIHPGVEPKTFFYILLGFTLLMGLLSALSFRRSSDPS